jgi:hypothetical protein
MTSEGAADQPFARTWQEAMDVYRFVLHPSIQCDLSMHLKLPGDDDQYDSDEDDHKQERKVEGAIQPSPNLYAKLKRGRMERQSFVTGCRHGEMPRNVDIACVAMQHTFVMHNFSFPDDHTPDARRNNPNLDRIMKCLEGAIPHGCSLHFMRLHQPNPELVRLAAGYTPPIPRLWLTVIGLRDVCCKVVLRCKS